MNEGQFLFKLLVLEELKRTLNEMQMEEGVLILMRGLPSCGKSYTAERISGQTGIVLETDRYFYEIVGEDPNSFDYNESMLSKAREWIFAKLVQAIDQRISPIVLDRGNGRNAETQRFALYAKSRGYRLELREPESPWWQELRVLLKYRQHLDPKVLDQWAEHLSGISRSTHRVPARVIRKWMDGWKSDLTVDQILEGR